MKKKKNKVTRVILTVLTIIIIMLAGSTLYLQWYALKAGGNERGKNIEKSYAYMYEHYPFLSQWVDSLQQVNALRDNLTTQPVERTAAQLDELAGQILTAYTSEGTDDGGN